jgi:hypothetical protein
MCGNLTEQEKKEGCRPSDYVLRMFIKPVGKYEYELQGSEVRSEITLKFFIIFVG